MSWIPTKEEITKEAENYNILTFFKKTKNILVTFIIGISLFNLLIRWSIINTEMFVSIGIYVVLAAFIYFNHRWAMVIFALLFTLDKVMIMIAIMPRISISSLVFTAIALILSYGSYLVANELKRAKKESATASSV